MGNDWKSSPLAGAHAKRFGSGAGFPDDYADIVAAAYAARGGLAQAAKDDDRRVGRIVLDWRQAQKQAARANAATKPKTRRASPRAAAVWTPPMVERAAVPPPIPTMASATLGRRKSRLLRTLYSFAIDPELLLELRRIKALDGISESEQLRRGARLWIERWAKVRGVPVAVRAGKLGEPAEPEKGGKRKR